MHLDLPIAQLVQRKGTSFQLGFATEAKELVDYAFAHRQPDLRDEFVLMASHSGLQVLASHEDGLAAPLEVLREVYGSSLHLEPPAVRLIEGLQVREPIMHVRLSVQTRFRETVKTLLATRGASLMEEHVRWPYCILCYEAPLADLIGVPAELSRFTSGAAKRRIVLSHYAPVKQGRAAARG